MQDFSSTPNSERTRITLFGRRNTGKSSLFNALVGQDAAIVSDVPGTTADPVRKAMELLPLGPVLFVDTAGTDDDQERVGAARADRARRELRATDVGVIVTDPETGYGEHERWLAAAMRDAGTGFVIAVNKCDSAADPAAAAAKAAADASAPAFAVSARTGFGVDALRSALAAARLNEPASQRIIGDRLSPGDFVVLVIPIDAAAPKGRLILPQQLTIRDILDSHAAFAAVRPEELEKLLESLRFPPKLVVTDSQVFRKVRDAVPAGIPVTSFSVLFARYKGDFETLRAGAEAVDSLRAGDRVLIAEGCTHRRQCGDIGSVKIPAWIERRVGGKLDFSFTSGNGWPTRDELKKYRLVVHCGGCTLARREMRSRIEDAVAAGTPIANYGLLIAKLQGVEL